MTYNFSKVLLHFIRVSVSVGEPSPISHLWLFVFKNPDLWSSLDAGFPKSVDIVYILWTQASFSPLPSWSCEVISSAAKVFPTQISMTCWKLTSRISLCLKFAPTLEVPHLWEVSFQLVGSWKQGYLWRVPLLSAWRAVQSGFLPFMNCAYCSPGKVNLTSGSELRGKERQSYRSKKRFQMSIKQQAAAPESESEVAQLCPTFCNPMDCSLPGFSIHGIFQARVLEWVAFCPQSPQS